MKFCSYLSRSLLISCILFFPQILLAQEVSKSTLASVALPVFGAVYSLTQQDFEGVKQLAYGSLFTAHLTTFLKNTVRRTRPNEDNDLSFPSGHAAASFTGASYFHHRYGLKVGLPMYAIATAISIQRVNVDDHYWTDVIAGAALGYLSGYLFTAKYPNVWLESSIDTQKKAYSMQAKMRF